MSKEDSQERSLNKHEVSKIRFSQIVIVVLLVFGIVTAVIVALPQSWQDAISEKTEEGSKLGEIVRETSQTTKTFRNEFSEIMTKIEDLKTIDNDIIEPVEVVIPESLNRETVRTTKYVNFDWNISFSLPPTWSYDATESAFISEEQHLKVTRMPEFILPDSWETLKIATTSNEGNTQYFKEVNEDVYHATAVQDIFTYVFTTTSTDTFTKEQQIIITSLSIL